MIEILIALALQDPIYKEAGLTSLEIQCMVRGLDCRTVDKIVKVAYAKEATKEELEVNSIEQRIKETFPEEPRTMTKIFKCESNLRQWNEDGSVITGKAGEKGLAQIHPVHFKSAKEKGIDVLSLEGNLEYARILYDTKRGKNHWSCYKSVVQ